MRGSHPTQREVLGNDHHDTRKSIFNLAASLANQYKFSEARQLYEEVLLNGSDYSLGDVDDRDGGILDRTESIIKLILFLGKVGISNDIELLLRELLDLNVKKL
jgi:hypothetical protein